MAIDDSITVIRTRGRRLAKLIRQDGAVEGYDDAKHFDLFAIPVADLSALYRLLRQLLQRSDCAVVRGAIADLVGRTRKVWQPRLGHELRREAARQIAANVTGFFSVLTEWSGVGRPLPANEPCAPPKPTEAQHER